jgi:4-amino-4-deoxy-L-arabinose transferase-like glycosyltransferase
MRGGLLLVVICLAVYLPGFFSIGAVDRDESRFAQASRQMAEGSTLREWVVPMVQDRPRLNKPPLIYWLQAASVRALSDVVSSVPAAQGTAGRREDAIWMYRVPSLIAAIIAVLATWRLGRRMFDPRAACLGALLLAVCPLMIWESKQARADMVLLACTTVAMASLWRVHAAARHGTRRDYAAAAVFWIAMTLGVLVKGPITPMVAGLCAVMLSLYGSVPTLNAGSRRGSRFGWLRGLMPVPGTLLLVVSVGTWVGLVAREVGWNEYLRLIADETLGRSVSAKEGHWGPPGYHLVALVLMFWPGVLLTGAAVGRAVGRGLPRVAEENSPRRGAVRRVVRAIVHRRAGRGAELFCVAWVVPSWIVFELVGTKLPHYTLPLYPALALLSARAVFAARAGVLPAATTTGARVGFGIWTLVGLALAAAPLTLWWVLATEAEQRLGVVAGIGSLAAGAWVLWSHQCLSSPLRRGKRGHFVNAQLGGVVAAGVVGVMLCGAVLPRLSRLWVSERVAAAIKVIDPELQRPLACVEYQEDSLIFNTHGVIRRLVPEQVDAFLLENPNALLVAPAEMLGQRTDVERLYEVEGFNYSNGKDVRIQIVQRATKPLNLRTSVTPVQPR